MTEKKDFGSLAESLKRRLYRRSSRQSIRMDLVVPCLVWQGPTFRDTGYGQISAFGKAAQQVHVMAWVLRYGQPPKGMCVLHRCDVRTCWEDTHLFLGTRDDNQKDMATKRRSASHERNGSAKLNMTATTAMRALYYSGRWSQSYIAGQFNVSVMTANKTVRRLLWK